MKRRNNKGMTLVELVVTIAILTIVVGSILGFLTYSVRQYKKSSMDVNLQNESQLTVNQLQNLIVNATNGVATNSEGTGTTGTELTVYNYTADASGVFSYRATRIYLDGGQLMYTTSILAKNGTNSFETVSTSTAQVLSSYMDTSKGTGAFSIDLSQLSTKNMVKVSLSFAVNGKTYTSDNSIKLRNEVVTKANGSADDYFANQSGESISNVSAVTISPESTYLWQGESESPFSAVVTADGKSYSGGSLVWTLDENTVTTGTTGINSSTGVVSVDESQTENLTVKAYSQDSINAANGDPSRYVVSNPGTILVKQVTGITISTPDVESDVTKATMLVIINGKNFDKTKDFNAITLNLNCGSLGISYTSVPEQSSSDALVYRVTVTRPTNFKGMKYKVTATAGPSAGTKRVSATSELFSFKEDEVVIKKTVSKVELLMNGVVADYSQTIARGSSQKFTMRVTYLDQDSKESSVILDSSQWNLSIGGGTGITQSNSGNVKTLGMYYNKAAANYVNAKATYTEGGQDYRVLTYFYFDRVTLSIDGTGSQNKFFMRTQQSEYMTMNVEGVSTYKISVAKEKGTITNKVSSNIITYTSGDNASESEFTISVAYSNGTIIDDASETVYIDAEEYNLTVQSGWGPWPSYSYFYIPNPDNLITYTGKKFNSSKRTVYKMNGDKVYYYSDRYYYYIQYNGNLYYWSSYYSEWRW